MIITHHDELDPPILGSKHARPLTQAYTSLARCVWGATSCFCSGLA